MVHVTLCVRAITHLDLHGEKNIAFATLFARVLDLLADFLRCLCVREESRHCCSFPFVFQSSSSGNPSLHCSMSSSADISDEDDYSVKSGSASPAPGDTLPWNLPRHERSKRKIQGGSVLDPAERAVLRIAGEGLTWLMRAASGDKSLLYSGRVEGL